MIAIPLLLLATINAPTAVPLADFQAIYVDQQAPAVDHNAAAELRTYIERMGGPALPIVTAEARPLTAGPVIFVGDSAARARRAPEVNLDGLGVDGIVRQTVERDLVLWGVAPRGTLYAVYSFLEDVLGVRWWTSTEETVPNRTGFIVPVQAHRYAPALRMRESFYSDAADVRFAPRLRVNGHFARMGPEWGGHDGIIGFCHTFYQFLPPDQYFADHPEWYSLRDGVRTTDGAQLCCTNPEMQAEMTRVVLDRIAKSTGESVISVSHNDWHGWCECANCTAVLEREGSQAGPLLELVNTVARAIAAEYPDILVETLAYHQTRKPPATARPEPNVLIRLCSIECDFGQTLEHGERNADFADDIRGWSSIAPQLFIWNYVTNFSNYLLPHPNLTALGPDIDFFVRHGAVGLFEQGDFGSTTGDFICLRAWLLAHLMWDPSQDQATLTREFLDGYYGAAGAPLAEYLALRETAREQAGIALRCYRTAAGDWFDLDSLIEADRLFDAAEAAVANDAVLLARVQRERLPLELVWVQEDRRLRREVAARGLAWPGPADTLAAAEAWREANLAANVGNFGEGRPFGTFGESIVARFQQIAPPPGYEQRPDDWLAWQDGAFTLHGLGSWVTHVDDVAATDGRAARMPGDHNQWAIQVPIGADVGGGRWQVIVALRGVGRAGAPADQAIGRVGIWDSDQQRDLVSLPLLLSDIGGDGYHQIDLGTFELTPTMTFWAAPVNSPDNVEALYVDRLYALVATDNGG